jgi:RNA polymerase sigma-70 factor (ECF subfamily)
MDMMHNPRLSPRAKDDYALVLTAISGNQRAYATLLERYRSAIFQLMLKRVNNHAEAVDLTMEAFGKAFNRLPSYSPSYAFSTWLFKIAMNNCIDYVRKKRMTLVQVGDAYAASDADVNLARYARSESDSPEDDLIRRQRIDLMQQLLVKLNPRYRRMIELRYYDDLSYEEISKQLDLPLGTVKAQLFRAKEALYNMLQTPGASAYVDCPKRA